MKKIILTLMCVGLALALVGCVSSSAGNNPSPAPTTAEPSPMASATMEPSATNAPMQGTNEPAVIDPNAPGGAVVGGTTNGMITGTTGTDGNGTNATMSPADAGKLGDKIADEVERLSEIDDAQVVVMGDTAVVAVDFDDQYKGGMTTRIQEMVVTRVQNVDKNITDVRVTNDPNLFTTVGDMAQSLTSGTVKVLDDIGDDFKTLFSKIVPVT